MQGLAPNTSPFLVALPLGSSRYSLHEAPDGFAIGYVRRAVEDIAVVVHHDFLASLVRRSHHVLLIDITQSP